MNWDGTQQKRLTYNTGYDTYPVYIPLGDKIAFVSDISGNPEIYLMDADGANPVQITSDSLSKENLLVSPEGTSIIYIASDMPGHEDIYSVNINTKVSSNLTESIMSEYAPILSPDGSKIYYQAMIYDWDIWSMDADGNNKSNLTNQSPDDTYPDILYDGSLIVFQSKVGSTTQLFTIDNNGNQLRKITDIEYNSYEPKFQCRR
jgi:TolB protein